MSERHPLVATVHEAACDHLDALRGYFVDPVRMTVIIRNLADPTGERDMVVTDDDLVEVLAAVERRRARAS